MQWEEPIPFEQRIEIPGRKGSHIMSRDGMPFHIGWEADMNTGNSWKKVARFGDSISASYNYHSKDAAEQMLTDMLACYIIEYGCAPDGQFRIGNGSNQLM